LAQAQPLAGVLLLALLLASLAGQELGLLGQGL
jgi:hypothetical protein